MKDESKSIQQILVGAIQTATLADLESLPDECQPDEEPSADGHDPAPNIPKDATGRIPGVGTLFHATYTRNGKRFHARTWYLRYSRNNRKYQVSLTTTKLNVATKRAKEVIARLGRGQLVGADANRLKFPKMAEMVKADYDRKGNRSKDRLEDHLNSLEGFFGDARAVDITAERIEAFVDECRKDGAAFGTIQNRLAALKRMFTLAERKMLINQRPAFPVLDGSKPRKGFCDPDQFWAIHGALPNDIKPVAEFGYYTGWRKSEIVTMKWDQVDFGGGIVRLWAGTTKNDEGRVFPFAAIPALKALLEKQRADTDAAEKATGKKIEWVFHRQGCAIKSFKKAWAVACDKAGVPDRIFHDLRRTAVRNLVRAGVPERIAMMMTGHKTRAVFERYNIVNENDMTEGAIKLAAFLEQHTPSPIGPDNQQADEGAKKKLAVGSGNLIAFPAQDATGKRKGKESPISANSR